MYFSIHFSLLISSPFLSPALSFDQLLLKVTINRKIQGMRSMYVLEFERIGPKSFEWLSN